MIQRGYDVTVLNNATIVDLTQKLFLVFNFFFREQNNLDVFIYGIVLHNVIYNNSKEK